MPKQHPESLLILPTNDIAFRYLLTAPEHPNVRAAFVRDAFGVEPDTIQVADPYSITKYETLIAKANATRDPTKRAATEHSLREVIRDVRFDIEIADVAIEMQVQRDVTFLERSLLYLAKMYVGSYAGDHGQVKPAWSLNILRHNWFPDGQALRFSDFPPDNVRQPGQAPLLRWGFLELLKQLDGPLKPWQHFFLTGEARKTDPEPLHEAASMMEYVNASAKEANVITQLQIWEKADKAEQAARDRQARAEERATTEQRERATADQRVAEERAAAERQRRKSIDAALASGVPIQQVADIFDTTIDAIRSLS